VSILASYTGGKQVTPCMVKNLKTKDMQKKANEKLVAKAKQPHANT